MTTRSIYSLLVGLAAVLLVQAGADGATISYDFDDGTLQGWTRILDDPGVQSYDAVTSFPGQSPQAGTHFLASPPSGGRDNAHSTILLRSPEFYLDGSGDLDVWMAAGQGTANFVADASSLPANSSGTGLLAFSLRRVSDGAYVLNDRRTQNNNTWTNEGFDAATLSGLADGTTAYTLDIYDSFSGGWGWMAVDSISIPGTASPVPEPSTIALAALGLLTLGVGYRLRRR